MLSSIQSSNLNQGIQALDQTALRIEQATTTERQQPDINQDLTRAMVDLVEIPHALEYNIKAVQTNDQMIGSLLDIIAK